MIDPRAYNKHEANNTFVPEIVDLLNPDDLTEQETLLLPSKVYGFCFGAKQWGAFAVHHVENITWDNTIYDSLMLKLGQKETIGKWSNRI